MPKAKDPVYIIIPVHNRKTVTLKCLETLKNNGDLDQYHVIVVDDGSTDGTSEALVEQHPDVIILYGDGNLWWTGSTKLGMEYAYSFGASYFIWLNDDTLPEAGAISKLISLCSKSPKQIIGGQCYSSLDSKIPTYGGFRRECLRYIKILAIPGSVEVCDSINGNLACLPRSIVEDLGYPNADKAPHYHGETTYSWQAKRKGYRLLLTGDAIAYCCNNFGDPSWLISSESVENLWTKLMTPKSPYYVSGYWYFCLNMWGLIGIFVFVQPYLRLILISLLKWIFPRSLLQYLKSSRPKR